MKKDKVNPDRDEMPGGARIEDKSKQRGSRTASNTNKTKAPQQHSEKRKTGKRSGAQKSRPTSVMGPA